MACSRALLLFCSVLCLGFTLTGCASSEDYTAERTRQILATYPPGKATRADVQKRWHSQPELSEARPASGWNVSTNPSVRARTLASEKRTGQAVYRCERYFGPDGWSGGLCYGWFYYDDRDYIVDAEWQWHTD
jgi:hypothetical protein